MTLATPLVVATVDEEDFFSTRTTTQKSNVIVFRQHSDHYLVLGLLRRSVETKLAGKSPVPKSVSPFHQLSSLRESGVSE